MLPKSGDCHSLCELPPTAEDADQAKPESRPHQSVDEKTQLRNSLGELTNSWVLIARDIERLHDDIAEEEEEEESTSADPWTPSVAISGEPRRVMTATCSAP